MFLEKAALVAGISDIQNSSGVFRITTNANHGLLTGHVVIINGVTGGGVNGVWTITKVNDTNFTLDGSTYVAPTNFAAGQVFVGDRLVVEVTTYSGTESHIVADGKYQDPATNAIARLTASKKKFTATGNVVVFSADPSYSLTVERLNIYNRSNANNLIVKIKYIAYDGTTFEIGTATIAALARYDEASGKSRSASGALDVP